MMMAVARKQCLPHVVPQGEWEEVMEAGAFGEVPGTPVEFGANGITRITRADGTKIVPVTERLLADLADCLDDMTKHYCEMVASGDAGNWNAEEEMEVKAARKLIAEARTLTP